MEFGLSSDIKKNEKEGKKENQTNKKHSHKCCHGHFSYINRNVVGSPLSG
jgi:hypothetical protein